MAAGVPSALRAALASAAFALASSAALARSFSGRARSNLNLSLSLLSSNLVLVFCLRALRWNRCFRVVNSGCLPSQCQISSSVLFWVPRLNRLSFSSFRCAETTSLCSSSTLPGNSPNDSRFHWAGMDHCPRGSVFLMVVGGSLRNQWNAEPLADRSSGVSWSALTVPATGRTAFLKTSSWESRVERIRLFKKLVWCEQSDLAADGPSRCTHFAEMNGWPSGIRGVVSFSGLFFLLRARDWVTAR